MPALELLQSAVRDALVLGNSRAVEAWLTGAEDPLSRLSIHQRHYRASLTGALVDRFPATAWLVGTTLVTDAAAGFVRAHPPDRPCIAEYGETFPPFLARHSGTATLPYLEQFATLEWHLGRLAVAVDVPAAPAPPDADLVKLADTTVVLQPNVHFLRLDWSLDELMAIYLSGTEPTEFALGSGEVLLQIRGNRGELQMQRLTPGDFMFRTRLASGATLGAGAGAAIDVETGFDVSGALARLLGEALVARFLPTSPGGPA